MARSIQPGEQVPVPRGRHAPPLEVRLTVQRRRLLEAAAAVFARLGYAEASAEAIAREAGMSKATFYEHFSNKEDAIVALFEEAATEITREMAQAAGDRDVATSYEAWVRRSLHAFLGTLVTWPDAARTLLVEIIGAGPRAQERRDAILEAFAGAVHRDNALMAPRFGAPNFAAPEDAFTIIGAIVEVASRQLRTGRPADVRDIEPTLLRVFFGILAQARDEGLGGA
jgi:AcrR family transcriptional regulator